ncbi:MULTISPECIES: PLD nuclease N-terminal domain-containing protein [unclassified Microbacterium]|uniref:PLD nuclease N-terminal domain-containing protein n=1 Tax=unclassified Microbacterium TaxID=2609290 RepID=UPI00188ED8C2|nr:MULTISPECIES: PLD nuclease N-terminal domain-containing protein [unclassified Microbacterium]
MARLLIVGGFLAAIFWVYSIVDCAVQPSTRHRGVRKAVWVAIVVLIPVIGGILWFVIGRRRANDPGDAIRVTGPDDDPTFLRTISKSEQDARIRRLEEELARLEDETDDGAAPDPRP